MSNEPRKSCPQCEAAMAPVVVMDNSIGRDTRHDGIEYRLPDDKQRFWTNRYPTTRQVTALMCSGCGLIQLYGDAEALDTTRRKSPRESK